MEKRSYTVAIDLGSSKVAVAVGGRNADGLVDVDALSVKPIEGVNAGRIENIELVSRAVKEAVAEVEEELGIRITEAYAGISGEFVRCARHTDHVFVYDPQNGVSRRDVDSLFDRMRNVQAPDDETIMERVPQNYVVDDAQEVKNPVGSFGKKLSSTFNFVLCHQTPMQRLDMALRRLGIRMLAVYPDALVTPEAVLLADEKEEGVAVVDLGAGTTDVAVYFRNVVRYVATVPIGASSINSDIRSLSVPEKYVENLKCKYGSAVAELAPENKLIRVSGRTAKEAKDILLRNLATVVEARATDIAEFVMQELKDSVYSQKLAYGLVLTGGSARLKDVDELFRRVTGMDVRIGCAETGFTDAAKEILSDPALATVAGILLKGSEQAPCMVNERRAPEKPAAEPAPHPAFASPDERPRAEFRHVPPKFAQPSAPAEATLSREKPSDTPSAAEELAEPAELPQTKRPGLLERIKQTMKNSAEMLNKKFEPGEDEEI